MSINIINDLLPGTINEISLADNSKWFSNYDKHWKWNTNTNTEQSWPVRLLKYLCFLSKLDLINKYTKSNDQTRLSKAV